MSGPATRISIGTGLVLLVAGLLTGDAALQGRLELAWAPLFWPLLGIVLMAGCYEFCRMLRLKGYPCRPAVAMFFTALMVLAAWDKARGLAEQGLLSHAHFVSASGGNNPMRAYAWVCLLVLMALTMVATLVEIVAVERRRTDVGRAAQSVAWTVLAVECMALPGVFLAQIRIWDADPWRGLMYLALFLGTVKAGDIGAYAFGSTLGRHPLTPTLSPKKTVEGLAGALVAGTGAALAIGCLWGGLGWWQMLVFGLVVSVAGVLGDLSESLLKRACGVKDSGPIPGFGGVLDILDSILGAAPVAYLVLVVLIR